MFTFINKINNYLKDVFDKIAGFGNLEIKYKSFIHEQDLNEADLKDFIINKYNSMFMNELLQKTTLLGCHKDDFKMYLNDLDVTEFSSQGQQRLSILSLKLAEIEVFVKEKHTKPIILLDDIFSELDEIKKNNIIEYQTKISQFRSQAKADGCYDKPKPKVCCPKCGSTQIQIVPRKFSFLTGFATNKTDRVCVNCKYKW